MAAGKVIQSYRTPSSAPTSRLDGLRRQIQQTILRFEKETNSYETPVPNLRMGSIRSPQPFTPYLYEASLCVSVRGVKHVLLGDERFSYDAHSFLLTCVGLPTMISVPDARARDPYVALQLILDLPLAAELMTEMDIHGIETESSSPGVAVAPLTEELLDSLLRLVSLVNNPRDIPVLHRSLHREILYRLLTQPIGARLRQIVRLGSPSSQTAKAISWLRQHLTEKISISDLAKVAGMASPTLFRHFRDMTKLSPLQYQKLLRLQEARHLMLREEIDAASAAYAVGYESVTQFNREYRRLFGNPPARHAKLIRKSPEESHSVSF